MAENENLLLNDKQIVPDDKLIFSIIKDKKDLWQRIMKFMHDYYKDSAGEWNYYNDGKRWLFKMIYKKKTVFWLDILEDTFRISVWFPNRAEPAIDNSELPLSIKDEFKNAKKYGSTRAVSIVVKEEADVENVIKLIAIRVSLK